MYGRTCYKEVAIDPPQVSTYCYLPYDHEGPCGKPPLNNSLTIAEIDIAVEKLLALKAVKMGRRTNVG